MANVNRKARVASMAFDLLDPGGQVGLKHLMQREIAFTHRAANGDATEYATDDILFRVKFPFDVKLIKLYLEFDRNWVDDSAAAALPVVMNVAGAATAQVWNIAENAKKIDWWEDPVPSTAIKVPAGSEITLVIGTPTGTIEGADTVPFSVMLGMVVFQPV